MSGRRRLLLLELLRQRRLHLVGACAAAAVASLLVSATAYAVPGPDSVAVVANMNVPESVALADAYARAREIPARQVCRLDLPTDIDITLDVYRTRFEAPFTRCLTDAGVLDRIEAVVLARGVPLRVLVPKAAGGTETASLAAVLGVWRSATTAGVPIAGMDVGMAGMCGGPPCRAARWRNPFNRVRVFDAGWSREVSGVSWQPLLVTMLHGRTYADAMRLVTSAIEGDRMGGARGRFMLMDGADAARGALDTEYPGVITAVNMAGFTDIVRVPFNADLEGLSLAAFFTGTAGIGRTIEGNTFAPGSITDNLTSYGAVPQNFDPTGESQVSIARWVSMGVAGAHGTVDEPLNNCFPSRFLLADYLRGSTLGEAYHRRLPFVYWKNLVLGDPITAPYATRPVVTITGVTAGGTIAGVARVTVRATDPMMRAIASVALFVDGVEVGRADGDMLEACVVVGTSTDVQLLAVAQIAYDEAAPVDAAYYQPKGWLALHAMGTAGATTCGSTTDAGAIAPDAGTTSPSDAATSPPDGGVAPVRGDDGGCGCLVAGASSHTGGGLVLSMLIAGTLVLRRRRRTLRSIRAA